MGGWERKQLRIELKDEEARVDLTRNAPDKRAENQRSENQLHDPKKTLKGKRSNSNTYVKIPHQSDEGAEE